MQLDVKALAIVGAAIWGGLFTLVALANLAFPSYGVSLLEVGASIYPGYHGPAGIGSVVVAMLYAVVDGAIGGAIIAWIYNLAAGRPKPA
jgi:hypothetical protein